MTNGFNFLWHRSTSGDPRAPKRTVRWLICCMGFVGLSLSNVSLGYAQCDEPTDETYASLMQQAREAWDTENYEAALDALNEADAQYDVAILSYSIARTLQFMERWLEADEAYRTFLQRFESCSDPHGLVPLAQEYRVTVLHMANEEAERLAELEQQPEPDEGVSIPGVTLLGVGGALLVSGLVFDLSKLGLQDDLQEAIHNNSPDVDELGEQRDTAVVVDWALYSGGLVLATVGTILLLVDGDDEENSPSVGFAPTDGGGAFSLGFRF